MDYVSSTYLISINCFRMLRLMNKKDSGLFGGPESETRNKFRQLAGMCGVHGCMWDEFSFYLLET